MKLTKTEASLLLPIGVTEFGGTDAELSEEITNAYYVMDDAPFPYWVRDRHMKTLERLANKMNFTIQ